MANVERWGSDRLDDLAGLVEAALPNERLSPDELLAVVWDRSGEVLGTPDGDAAVAVALVDDDDGGHDGGGRAAALLLVAVHPGRRRLGVGAELVEAAAAWAHDREADDLVIGTTAGASLWPGVDVHRMPAMLCLAESAGFVGGGLRTNLSLPATFRAEPPAGIAIRRVLAADDEAAVLALVADAFPAWIDAVGRSIERGSCLVAVAVTGEPAEIAGPDPVVVGFAAHSVERDGWLGPMGTASAHRRRGIGSALLGAVARDLMVANHRDVEVVGADQVRLFVGAGGSVSRVFRTFRRPLGEV